MVLIKHRELEEIYSLPGIIVLGRSSSKYYQLTACLAVNNYRLVIIKSRNTITKINMIPYSLGGDIVEKIFDNHIVQDNNLYEVVEKTIYNTLFIGGYIVSIAIKNSIEPISLFLPSNKLKYFLTNTSSHSSYIPEYRFRELIMIGYLLQKGDLELLRKFCSNGENSCSIESHYCVSFNVWRNRKLIVCSRDAKSIDKTISIVPDNNPMRHVVIT